jgi:two-component system, sensor histidine kinase
MESGSQIISNDLDIEEFRLDSTTLRVRQAQLLADRARGSGLSVFALVSLNSLILTFSAPFLDIGLWFVAATLMICVTLILPRAFQDTGIHAGNAKTYLFLHTLISSITGCIWGFGAVWLTNLDSEVSVFTTSMMVLGITLGGVSPQSAYRRSYVGLATSVMLPYAAFLLLWADWPVSAAGGGVLLGYLFFMSSSARVEAATTDALAVTNNKTLMAELRRQRDELQKISEEKTRFLAATSHDLAQPLHAQGFFLAALREKLQDPSQLELLKKVETSWRGIGGLLDGLVDVSRLDAGAIVPDFRDVDLGGLAQRVMDEFAAVASDKQVSLEGKLEPVFARTDPILISRVLRNLLSNAIKFTDPGGKVSLKVEMRDGDASVTISDTGCGIAIDQQEAIFGEYVQLGNRERNREKGLGLGLSIVRRLAKLLSVELLLESDRGKGTRFYLTIPGTADRSTVLSEKSMVSAEAEKPISNLCVLIVDDEDAIRTGMSTLLSSWGAQVFSAASGDDLVELIDHIDIVPDVLVVDQRLEAGETGQQVIERLRDEVNEAVPVILMSGDISPEIDLKNIGNIRLMQKPVDPGVLREILSEIPKETGTSADQSV